MKLGPIIRKKRKELSLTQEQVAACLGVSAPAVHKWEKGSAYPDIPLLPSLARLLKTDLNTLLSFQEDLSDREIIDFVDGLDQIARQHDYERAFQTGMSKLREYPSCEGLIYSVILYLDGARLLYRVPEPERYETIFEPFYERLTESENTEIRETAAAMLISYNRKRKHYSKAGDLIQTLSSPSVDREEQLALLYTAQEQYPDALTLWEGRVLKSVTNIQTALMNMMDIAVTEHRLEDAGFYAALYETVSRSFRLPQWLSYTARLQLSVVRQDKTECLSILSSILSAIREPWSPQASPLYRHLSGSGMNALSERLFGVIEDELKNSDDFSFLTGSPEYRQLLKEWHHSGP